MCGGGGGEACDHVNVHVVVIRETRSAANVPCLSVLPKLPSTTSITRSASNAACAMILRENGQTGKTGKIGKIGSQRDSWRLVG